MVVKNPFQRTVITVMWHNYGRSSDA